MLRLDHRIVLFLIQPHMGCNPSLLVENLNDMLRQLDVDLFANQIIGIGESQTDGS